MPIRLLRWAIGVTITLVLIPLLVQLFYERYVVTHLGLVGSILAFRWTPAIVGGAGVVVIVLIVLSPDLIRRQADTSSPQSSTMQQERGATIQGSTVITGSNNTIINPPAPTTQPPLLSAPVPPPETRASWMQEAHISNRSFRIVDVLRGSESEIQDRTFEDCTILGPAVIVPAGCRFEHTKFAGTAEAVYLGGVCGAESRRRRDWCS